MLSLNLDSPGDVRNEDLELLRRVLPKPVVEGLANSRVPTPISERIAPDYVVEFDPARKDRVIVNGQGVHLTPLQTALFRGLAMRAGVCVEFETLIGELWPSVIGDAKRIHREKNSILAKVRKALGNEAEGFILASKGIGLALNARVVGALTD